MAIVQNWAKPLVDSLLAKLNKPDLSPGDINRISGIAALLDGAPGSDAVQSALQRQVERLEASYQAAVKQVREGEGVPAIEEGMDVLRKLGEYKDAPSILQEGQRRVADLRDAEEAAKRAEARRKRIIGISVAAAAVAVFVLLIAQSSAKLRKNQQRVAAAQQLVDAGETSEALDAIFALADDGVTGSRIPELYDVTEGVLESTASQEGFDAAFAQFDLLSEGAPDTVNATLFKNYAQERLNDKSLSARERWKLLQEMNRHDMYFRSSDAEDAAAALLAELPAEEAWNFVSDAVREELIAKDSAVVSDAFAVSVSGLPVEEAWKLAEEAIESGTIQKDSSASTDIFAAYVATLPGAEAWTRTLEAVDEGMFSAKSDVVVTALNDAMEKMDGADAWRLAADAVEAGTLEAKNDLVSTALLKAMPGLTDEEAWRAAQRAVSLKALSISDEIVESAFQKYIRNLDTQAAWNETKAAVENSSLSRSLSVVSSTYLDYLRSLPAEEVWPDYTELRNNERLSGVPNAEAKEYALNTHLGLLIDALDAGTAPDMEALIGEEAAIMSTIGADPNVALRFLYALHDAGCDVASLLPNGMRVHIPLTLSIYLSTYIGDSGTSSEIPDDASSVLPVSIVESDMLISNPAWDEVLTSDSSDDLESEVESMQLSDSHYDIRLLTKYLYQIPDALRPATFDDCDLLLCMQSTFQMGGSISSTTTSNKPYFSSFTRTSVTYYPFFTAVDSLLYYDMRDAGGLATFGFIDSTEHPAQVEDESWFNAHKGGDEVLKVQNRSGSFNRSYLKSIFDITIDTMIQEANGVSEEVANDEAD